MAELLEACGASLIVIGLAFVALPAALIVAGVFLLFAAWSLEPARVRR